MDHKGTQHSLHWIWPVIELRPFEKGLVAEPWNTWSPNLEIKILTEHK